MQSEAQLREAKEQLAEAGRLLQEREKELGAKAQELRAKTEELQARGGLGWAGLMQAATSRMSRGTASGWPAADAAPGCGAYGSHGSHWGRCRSRSRSLAGRTAAEKSLFSPRPAPLQEKQRLLGEKERAAQEGREAQGRVGELSKEKEELQRKVAEATARAENAERERSALLAEGKDTLGQAAEAFRRFLAANASAVREVGGARSCPLLCYLLARARDLLAALEGSWQHCMSMRAGPGGRLPRRQPPAQPGHWPTLSPTLAGLGSAACRPAAAGDCGGGGRRRLADASQRVCHAACAAPPPQLQSAGHRHVRGMGCSALRSSWLSLLAHRREYRRVFWEESARAQEQKRSRWGDTQACGPAPPVWAATSALQAWRAGLGSNSTPSCLAHAAAALYCTVLRRYWGEGDSPDKISDRYRKIFQARHHPLS